MTARVRLKDALGSLPPEWPADPLPAIRASLAASGEKVAVVDDDPAGMQSVSGVSVLMDWSCEMIERELRSEYPGFFVVTNSRGMQVDQARETNSAVGRNLRRAERSTERRLAVISRWDSTLRGHFPAEVEALETALGGTFDAWVLAPFFLEGGRYTIGDVHYVSEDGWLTPVGESEFARDPAFGYRSSDMKLWVEEATGGGVAACDVASISIDDIRLGGPEKVAERLLALSRGKVCVVNAASNRDIDVFASATLIAEREEKRFLYRSAASFIRSRLGQEASPPLTSDELVLNEPGGVLVLVGSHVERSTSQLEHLLSSAAVTGIEVDVRSLLSSRASAEIDRVSSEAGRLLARGCDVVVYTSRELVSGDHAEENLQIGQQVSDGIVSIVRAIRASPRAVISKGGMTTYNVCRRALGVTRAVGIGQILPGVPVWRLGSESRLPDSVVVVFPGNVGSVDALSETLLKLSSDERSSR